MKSAQFCLLSVLSLSIFSIMAIIFQVWFCRFFYFLFFLIPFDTGAKNKKKTAAGKVNFQRDIPKPVTQIAVYIISKRRIQLFYSNFTLQLSSQKILFVFNNFVP